MSELEELEYENSGGPSDEEMDKLDGSRVKIASCEVVDGTSKFGHDGKPLPEGQEIQVKKLKLVTEEFGFSQIGRNITHSEDYNLKFKDGKWKVSLHEKSKAAQFLAKYKMKDFKNVKGTEVVIIKRVNPDTKKGRLRISI
jgi:hypothetical protein